MHCSRNINPRSGFTLVELSIVLVIIGLIIGGILLGTTLIEAARVRGQVSQFENYNSAISTFRTKYNDRPGDMLASNAAASGLRARAGTDGEGDGDAIIEPCPATTLPGCEYILFWADLSQANLIDGRFDALQGDDEAILTANFEESKQYFPVARVADNATIDVITYQYRHYFSLAQHESIGPVLDTVYPVINTITAYQIDSKIDDGKPYTGKTFAGYPVGLYNPNYMPPLIPNNNRCADIVGTDVGYNVDRPDVTCWFYVSLSTW